MSDLTAYYGCNCCSHHISYPAYELGITEDGTLWHWECYENKYDYDDPNKPVLEKFVPPMERERDALVEAAKELKSNIEAAALLHLYRSVEQDDNWMNVPVWFVETLLPKEKAS